MNGDNAKMKARPIIALLLVLVIQLATAGTYPAIAQESLRVVSEEALKLTPEEEREVRNTVKAFKERLRETNDFEQIIDAMFVKDFSERLWAAPTNALPWAFLDKAFIASAGRQELLRYYVASMNFNDLFVRLSETAEAQRAQSENNQDELPIDAILSPEVINVLLGDPTIGELAIELKKEDENERTKETESNQPAKNGDSTQAASATPQADGDDAKKADEIGIIKSSPQLNGVSTTIEKANDVMRKRLASMLANAPAKSGGDNTNRRQDALEIFPTTLDEDEYGYSKGTPVIEVTLLPFSLTLVRIDGQLKILAATVYVD